MNKTKKISFIENGIKSNLQNRIALKDFIQLIIKTENYTHSIIDYIFCSDEFLLEINISALQHNYYTDIITFDLSESKKNITAEIYISVDRVKENAILFNQSFNIELHRVIFHGILHLCGYSDKTKQQKILMSNKEDFYLNKYFNI